MLSEGFLLQFPRHLCLTKVKLQRLDNTEVDSSSLNDAHRSLTDKVKRQQESHRIIRALSGEMTITMLLSRPSKVLNANGSKE